MRDDLHWLLVRQRIQFKLCMLVRKCLRRTAPSYITDMCVPVSTVSDRSCLLWSCSRRDLRVPSFRLTRYGPCSFSVSGPTAWNSLPTSGTVCQNQFGHRRHCQFSAVNGRPNFLLSFTAVTCYMFLQSSDISHVKVHSSIIISNDHHHQHLFVTCL